MMLLTFSLSIQQALRPTVIDFKIYYAVGYGAPTLERLFIPLPLNRWATHLAESAVFETDAHYRHTSLSRRAAILLRSLSIWSKM